jgi:hypothetical protein
MQAAKDDTVKQHNSNSFKDRVIVIPLSSGDRISYLIPNARMSVNIV